MGSDGLRRSLKIGQRTNWYGRSLIEQLVNQSEKPIKTVFRLGDALAQRRTQYRIRVQGSQRQISAICDTLT